MAEQIFYFFSSKRILYNILLSIFTHTRNIYFLKKDIAWYKHLGWMTHTIHVLVITSNNPIHLFHRHLAGYQVKYIYKSFVLKTYTYFLKYFETVHYNNKNTIKHNNSIYVLLNMNYIYHAYRNN